MSWVANTAPGGAPLGRVGYWRGSAERHVFVGDTREDMVRAGKEIIAQITAEARRRADRAS
jgi:hypothetical protein